MDYFVEYCRKIYVDESTFYVNKLIKEFHENGWDKDLTTAKSLPLKQYRIYKIYKVSVLEYNMKKYNIKSIEKYRYEYHFEDNNLKEYLKELYFDKTKEYIRHRKCILNKKIVAGDRSPLIYSFLEYDKMCMIVRDIRAGVLK